VQESCISTALVPAYLQYDSNRWIHGRSGQMLRTALSLSLVTGQPFVIEKIRAKRDKPGLLRQHLTAVLAASEIGGAKVDGATLGSKTLTFAPGKIRPGAYHFAVGTAGSGTLVFQTILPALMTASGPSSLVIEGGTHNTQAPPFDFLAKTFLPVLRTLGPKVNVKLERYGFSPAGGGRFTAEIEPCRELAQAQFLERGEITHRRAVAVVANLARQIAQREVEIVGHFLGWNSEWHEVIETRDSPGPGNVVLIEIGSGSITEVFSGFGRLGASAEKVASEAAGAARSYLASGALADEHLADQLLLPLALAGGGSFTATKVSLHARTNMEVISLFLPVTFRERQIDRRVEIEIMGG
jgi:RNA 3'-terminal phosphate cyclase (ATP)